MAESTPICPAPKLKDFYSLINDNTKLLEYLRALGLLDSDRNCNSCGHKMTVSRNMKKSEKEEWRCGTCLHIESIRINSIFESSKLTLQKQMELLYYFGVDMQVYEVEKFTDVSHVTIIEFYKRLRQHISMFLLKDPISLGNSEGSIVEIDESLFGKKRKYNRGSGKQDTWVFGMKEKGTRKVVFHIVEKRNKDTLLPLIQNSVQRGCRVYSDCWRAYSTLQQQGYDHSTVNHSVEFKAEDGTCTNEIEGVWSLVKLKIKSMKGILHDKIGQLLDEFTYRHRYGLSNGDVYHKLVYDIARLNNSTDNQK